MNKPFSAYQGEEPYVFVCYAHADAALVYPELAWLHDQGINIWYDEGISPGKNWRETIGKALLGASTFVVYLSRASLESDHCNREINLALDEGKEVIPVYLEPIELTADLKIGLNRLQALTADRSGKHRETLLDTIGQVPPTESTSVPHRRSSHRRASLLLIAAVFLILAAAGSWVVINDDNQQTQSLPALNLYERSFTTSDPTEKIELLEKALEYDPGFLDARAHLAYELLQVGESGLAPPLPAFRRARDEALEVLAMDPQHAMGTAALARTYLQLDLDANKALETFIRAESLGAHSSMSAIFKAAIYLNTGKYDKAENTMRAAHERYPDSVGVAEFYARCLYLSGNVQAAWSMFDKALQLNPREQNAVIFSLSMAMAEKDASRIRELTKVIPTDAMIRGLGEPQAAAAEGNFEPLREILSFYEANRESYGTSAIVFTYGYWWIKAYEKHIRWYAIREQEHQTLYFTNFDIAIKPGYWEKLEAWSVSEPDKTDQRQRLLREHRNRIEHITAKMVL